MLNLRHIEVFQAVYQAGSLSGAARLLGVSQPSVSKVLRHAESRLGFTLFGVVKGRLVATEEAHILFKDAREVRANLDILFKTARSLRSGSEGHLRFATLHSIGHDLVPAAVAGFAERYPDVSFEIRTLHNDELEISLHDRSNDFVITYDVPTHPRLTYTRLGSADLVLLFRKVDLPDPPAQVSLKTLRDRRLIRLANAGVIGSLVNAHVEHADPAGGYISVQSYFVAAALVRNGAGFAVVDEFTARGSLNPELDFRPFEDRLTFEVFGVHLEDRPLSNLAQLFIKSVCTVLADASVRSPRPGRQKRADGV